jgi:hypothetical protein
MAFAILILWTAAYAAILTSIQEARSKAGLDVATPQWWERQMGKRQLSIRV